MMFFSRRKLTEVDSLQKQLHIQEALAAQGISSSVKVRSMARDMERRARLGGSPGTNVDYTIYVHKNDYDRAAYLLQSLRRGI